MNLKGRTPWFLSGAIPYDASASHGFAMPIINFEADVRLFSQICYNDFANNIELYEVNANISEIIILEKKKEIEPYLEQLVVFTEYSKVKFAGYVSELSNNIDEIIPITLPPAILLQAYELVGDYDRAKLAITALSNTTYQDDTSLLSFLRSDSRDAFYKVAAGHLGRSEDEIAELRNLFRLCKLVNNWNVDSIPPDAWKSLISKLTISEEQFRTILHNRRTIISELHDGEASPSEDADALKAKVILNQIKSLTRQELRLGRCLKSIHKDHSVSSELFKIYNPRPNFETYGLQIIRENFEKLSKIGYEEMFKRIITSLFHGEYPHQRGVLLKDLAKELNDIPEANKAIEAIASSTTSWSVHVWENVISMYLNGEILSYMDEKRLMRR